LRISRVSRETTVLGSGRASTGCPRRRVPSLPPPALPTIPTQDTRRSSARDFGTSFVGDPRWSSFRGCFLRSTRTSIPPPSAAASGTECDHVARLEGSSVLSHRPSPYRWPSLFHDRQRPAASLKRVRVSLRALQQHLTAPESAKDREDGRLHAVEGPWISIT